MEGGLWRLHTFIFGMLVVVGAAAKIYPGSATWYGNLHGDGSDGGACGYGKLVDAYGYIGRDTAVSDFLFQKGQGCGACYKIKCVDREICNNTWVTVVVTDECPGGGNYCTNSNPHFDLSGSAIDRLASQADKLRDGGLFRIAWKRASCTYGNQSIVFRVMEGSTSYWLSLLVAFVNGDGNIGSMKLKEFVGALVNCGTASHETKVDLSLGTNCHPAEGHYWGNIILRKECFRIESTLKQVSFFRLFISSSFGDCILYFQQCAHNINLTYSCLTPSVGSDKSKEWINMTQVWGASWCVKPVNSQQPLKGPFSIKLEGGLTGKTRTFRNVIPANWEDLAASKHTAYISNTNFKTTHHGHH